MSPMKTLVALLLLCAFLVSFATAERPNIVLILADDLGLGDVSTGLAHADPFFVAGQDPKPMGKVWKQVDDLSDDFEGASLDATKWQSEPVGSGWGWDGRPPALFKASNVTVKEGKMRVTVGKLDQPVVKDGKTFTHQGAIVRSRNPGRVGWYFECRMKANQTVMSSTFWLMTKNDTKKKLELDIQECVGRTTEKTEEWGKHWYQIFHSNAIHRTNRHDSTKVQLQAQMKLETKNSDRYYVYGGWWKSPDEIRFYLDGQYAYPGLFKKSNGFSVRRLAQTS